MKTISQVAELTGISTRTLQYYDQIGLLKPSKLTSSGYRLYDDEALGNLQQILFFRELGFKLAEIKEILKQPEFDRVKAFSKQKELLLLKRNRIDRLVELLSRLEKGEQCMSFKEFDMSEYVQALESFQKNNPDEIIRHWGSMEIFDLFIQKVKDDESYLAQLAIKQYGSIENYMEAMKYNMEHFTEILEAQKATMSNADELLQKNQELYRKLTANMEKDIASDEIQDIVGEIVTFTEEKLLSSKPYQGYWDIIINSYTNEISSAIADERYGKGASAYIAAALEYYLNK